MRGTKLLLKIKSGPNPMKLIGGVYNPPIAMSKTTAKKWAKVAEMKDKRVEKKDIKTIAKEKEFVIDESMHGWNLVRATMKAFKLDPNTARLKILAGEVWVKNSLHSKYMNISPKDKVVCGDVLAGAMRLEKDKALLQEKVSKGEESLKLAVLYKDKDIIIINKDANLVMHAGTGNKEFNIDKFLDSLKSEGDIESPRLVHRLDKNTTGCLILARSKESAARLSKLFQDPDAMVKRYVALLVPPKPEYEEYKKFTITSGIVKYVKDEKEKMRAVEWNDEFEKDPAGFRDIKKAVTDVTVLRHRTLSSLVCLEPKTGRKHQLRVHMAGLGSFILGDFKYGLGVTKQAAKQLSDPLKVPLHLHFIYLVIKDWFGKGQDLIVTAPPPDFWKRTLASSGHSMECVNSVCANGDIVPYRTIKEQRAYVKKIEREARLMAENSEN